jgi:hypothetical protein
VKPAAWHSETPFTVIISDRAKSARTVNGTTDIEIVVTNTTAQLCEDATVTIATERAGGSPMLLNNVKEATDRGASATWFDEAGGARRPSWYTPENPDNFFCYGYKVGDLSAGGDTSMDGKTASSVKIVYKFAGEELPKTCIVTVRSKTGQSANVVWPTASK